MAGIALLLAALLLSAVGAEVRPATFWSNLGNFGSYFARLTMLDTGSGSGPTRRYWYWGLRRWSLQLGQTLLIAYVGTFTGAVLGVVGGVLASRTVTPSRPLRFIAIRVLEFDRTVPDLVFALIFVVAFGLGPLPGVLAITLHTAGTLGKLFAEVIENIDMRPVEGVQGAGGAWLSQIRFGVLPQVLSNLASYTLLRFEVNVRGAAVIGFVGAGGIGQELIVAIRKFYYSDVSAILLMLLACVMAIDFASEKLRHRLLAVGPGALSGAALRAELLARRATVEAKYGELLAGGRDGRSATLGVARPRLRPVSGPGWWCWTSRRSAYGRAWANSGPSAR